MLLLYALLFRARSRLSREEGQTTAEYALVILAAAAVAVVLIAWAHSSGKLPRSSITSSTTSLGMPTRRDRRQVGSAAVEFALVLPLVLVLALALVQVGILIRDRCLWSRRRPRVGRVLSPDRVGLRELLFRVETARLAAGQAAVGAAESASE